MEDNEIISLPLDLLEKLVQTVLREILDAEYNPKLKTSLALSTP